MTSHFGTISSFPKLCGGDYGNNLEVGQIFPCVQPWAHRFLVRGLHQLETTLTARLHPTRLIGDALRQHSSLGTKAFADCFDIFKLFDDHEEHVSTKAIIR